MRITWALPLATLLPSMLLFCGIVSGQTYTQTILHNFGSIPNDGKAPVAYPVFDAAGNLYGTTDAGGGNSENGTVYKINSSGKETFLHVFTGLGDGATPAAPLVIDSADNVYG